MAWKIDNSHSQIQFTVRHMMISNVRGRFEEFTGEIDFDENDLTTLKAHIEIDAASINTRDEQRDAHLRSADFLLLDEHPKVIFDSTSTRVLGGNDLEIDGNLTIRGVSRPVTLKAEFAGTAKSPWGTTSAGFSAHAKINRKDWGLVWNGVLETGGVLVGEDVKIDIELELVKVEVPETVGEVAGE